MGELGISGYANYQDQLEVTAGEFTELFDTILINLTRFFRDKEAWDFLSSDVVPRLLDRPELQPIRVWSAACSSGEEACTVAMIMAEAMGQDAFRERVKIYATDVDEQALNAARLATFSTEAVEDIPAPLLEKYFRRDGSRYAFLPAIRRSIVFGRNDLVQDAPISHIDLLISRNALMYFTRETQARVLRNFNFALEEDGFLFLGKSEMLLTHSDLFTPFNLRWRLFNKVRQHGYRDRLRVIDGHMLQTTGGEDLRARAAETIPVAQVVLDRSGFVVMISAAARELFALGPADVGRPFQDLAISYRPLDLRSALEPAYADDQPVALGNVEWTNQDGAIRTMSARVVPIGSRPGSPDGASILFEDVTQQVRLARAQRGRPAARWRPPTRSSSPPSRSSRPPTRSCSRPTRSSRPPTRSSSRPTRSSRR